MESSNHQLTALLFISMFFISTATPIALDCVPCGRPPQHHPPTGKPPSTHPPTHKPPITLPPVVKPPITLPPVVKPPITLPPVVKPPITLPPVVKPPITLPPVVKPPITLPPVVKPPITLRGGCGTPGTPGTPCPPPFVPAPAATCPIDTLKLGACVDLLGGLVHIGLGDPVVNQCCPILAGLVELEAAVCLCTTLKLKLLNINIYLPLALHFQDPIRDRIDESMDEVDIKIKNSLCLGRCLRT
ncbi:hypothetical protein L1987_50005 [Smallanthus sonchifolius]|uniref:Uncharacterized protein n=1 Tax=Smallanthus sonchifolius TaxID=185202 RepID=A0ACB9FW86_9ASTR|nr:hypothetical protein L1987_50005 [Smallanthus sonchifolius]